MKANFNFEEETQKTAAVFVKRASGSGPGAVYGVDAMKLCADDGESERNT